MMSLLRTCLTLLAMGSTAAWAQGEIPARVTELARHLDPELRLVDGAVMVASSAEATCTLLNAGLGLEVAGVRVGDVVDPRILVFDAAAVRAEPAFEMPDGFDPCIWTGQMQILRDDPEVTEVEIRVFLAPEVADQVDGGAGGLVPRLWLSGEISPTVLGLAEDAPPNQIAPRLATLRPILTRARIAANSEFYGPVASIQADQVEALLEDLRNLTDNQALDLLQRVDDQSEEA